MATAIMSADLKSLAHPEWPYAGTCHAWRGFVLDLKGSEPVQVTLRRWEREAIENAIYQKQNFGPELK